LCGVKLLLRRMHDSSLSKSLVSLWPKFDLCEFLLIDSSGDWNFHLLMDWLPLILLIDYM